nr:YdiU family protein [Lentibacter algarum]
MFNFDNTYARELEGFYVSQIGAPAPAPKMLAFNSGLAAELGLDATALNNEQGARIFAGSEMPEGASPLSMAYAGHQFGNFSAQLGDGRALLLGEVIDTNGKRRDIHLKGSGRTPFSRGGDGKAVIGPVLREYLIGEAMHALGVPTTRALAAVTTGAQVMREGPQPGAVLARVASSHLRVGTFQFFAARGEADRVKQLADYAIVRHYPDLAEADAPYEELLRAVMNRQASLIAKWMSLGFVHGVMNTDNMTISGETIDYGPCAFLDAYNPKAVFSSIDQFGRYAYSSQPAIGGWNLARLAESLLDLINPDSDEAVRIATEILAEYLPAYEAEWLDLMRSKLGLFTSQEGDKRLVDHLFSAMHEARADFTQVFRALPDPATAAPLFETAPEAFEAWLPLYAARLQTEPEAPRRKALMDGVNPVYIPRNHKVEEALSAASEGDILPFEALLKLLQTPFHPQAGFESYAEPAPAEFGPYRTFCGT